MSDVSSWVELHFFDRLLVGLWLSRTNHLGFDVKWRVVGAVIFSHLESWPYGDGIYL